MTVILRFHCSWFPLNELQPEQESSHLFCQYSPYLGFTFLPQCFFEFDLSYGHHQDYYHPILRSGPPPFIHNIYITPKVDDFPFSIRSAILCALLKLICYAFVQQCLFGRSLSTRLAVRVISHAYAVFFVFVEYCHLLELC